MSESRLSDYLDHIQQAAADARTVQKWLPQLLQQLSVVRQISGDADSGSAGAP